MANLRPKFAFAVLSCLLVISTSGCGDIEGEIASLTVSPASPTIGINQSQLFTVSGKNDLGFVVVVDPTWSVTGSIGSINSSSGLFTAGATPATGTVVATYGDVSGSSSVTVTDKGWVAGRVSDSQGSRVPSLKVYLMGTTLLDFTDSNGNYSISDVPAGTYEVWTQETDAYRATSKEAEVESGETKTVNFTILFFTDPPDLNPPEFTL